MPNILDNPYIMEKMTQGSGYTESRIPEVIREEADYILIQRDLGTAAVSAGVTIGNGENGVISVVVDAAGSDGNLWTLEVEVADFNSADLSASLSGEDITVTLGTDAEGDPDDSKNTATLVAAEIDGLSGVTAEANGDGSGVITENDVAVYNFSGGVDKVDDWEYEGSSVAKDYQIVKTPNSDELFNHVGDSHMWIMNKETKAYDNDVNILVISLNGKWMRNY